MTWRAVNCVVGRELSVRDKLAEARPPLSSFCPYDVETRRVKKRGHARSVSQQSDVAMFPGYIFVDVVGGLEALRAVSGVLDVVRCGCVPLEVPGRVMSRLQALADEDGRMREDDVRRAAHWFPHGVGTEFIFRGDSALTGLLGRIISLARLEDRGEIEAWVTLFGRTSHVTLDYTDVGRVISAPRALAAAA